jgi:hypothetical protein
MSLGLPKTTSLLYCFAVIVVWAACVVAAAQQPAMPQRPAAPGTGLIAGRIVEAGSQAPVAEAIVTLFGPGDATGFGERRRVMADGQGRFAFAGLPAGRYRVISDQFGYVYGAFGKVRMLGDALPIDLADGQRRTDATIPMWRFVSLSGRVVDEAGEPMVGIRVFALQRSVRNGQAVLEPAFDGGTIRTFTTDDRGMYRASLLPPGDYTIAVPATVSTFPVDVIRDALDARIDLGVGETARLGDQRYLQLGDQILATMSRAPIPPARDGGPLTVYETTFHPGAASVDQAMVVSLAAGESRADVNIRLVAKPTVRVSGQLLAPDGPVPLTPFRLVRAGGTYATEYYGLEAATGITDARGQFVLLGVPRGSYILRVEASRPAVSPGARPTRLFAGHAVAVGDADLADVTVNVRPGAIVSGRVEVRGSQPIAASTLMLAFEGRDRGFESRVGNDYRFSAELAPGRYLVMVRTANGACVSTSGGKDVSDDTLEVTDQNITDVLVVCGDKQTRITGTVRDDRGQLDAGARVVVFSADRRFWSGPEYRKRRNASAPAAAGATFDVKDLPPGEYFVAAVPDMDTAEWELPAVREKLIPSAVRITLGAGESRTLELRTTVIK